MTSRKPDLADAAAVLARAILILEDDVAGSIDGWIGHSDPHTIDAMHDAQAQADARERQGIVDDARAILAAREAE